MGSPKDYAEAMAKKVVYDWYRDSAPSEWPQRRVKISRPFELGKYETTLAQFRRFVEVTGYRTDAERDGKGAAGKRDGKWVEQAPEFNWREMGYSRGDDEPVVNVSWNDAVVFCEWLRKSTGTKHRLPTEAEWEYTCRAGSTHTFFWGDDEVRRKEFAWSGDNSGGHPHPVGQLQPNAWGLHDMLGNAYEYCADGWSTNIAAVLGKPGALRFTDPLVKVGNGNAEIVVRSTSWGTNALHCRNAFRGSAPKDHRNHRDGFRVVRESVTP
ncbi:MAG: formylglycine-generating enzyme family protein [Verrucomicrobia bacterium]|nr:formylglycine-generating enzyme family protein [Verrucomicrobiota bacterium]